MEDFADAMIASPTGAGMLAHLEAQERDDVWWNRWAAESEPAAVTRAAEAVERMTFEKLCLLAVDVGSSQVGPWCGGELADVALQEAPERRRIAVAIDDCFSLELHAPFDGAAQEWWWSGYPRYDWNPQQGSFVDFDSVYGCGEIPWAGLWTVSDPPRILFDELIVSWEFAPEPFFRFRLPAIGSPRVREVHRPADWRALVLEYPRVAAKQHTGWEFARWENPKQQIWWNPLSRRLPSHVGVPRHLNPDWAAVARDWDAIHLSWAGYITADGFVDVKDDTVTMLRYWGSERTLWLSDPGGDIVGAPAPGMRDGWVNDPWPVSTVEDNEFTERWRSELSHRLGRS